MKKMKKVYYIINVIIYSNKHSAASIAAIIDRFSLL